MAYDKKGEAGGNACRPSARWSSERASLGLSKPTGITGRRSIQVLIAFLALLVGAGTLAWARSTATVAQAATVVLTVETNRPGSEFAPGSVGLSMGTQELSSGHLSPLHHRLVRLMRLLGPSVLRIGANTVDSSWWTSNGESPPSWATNTVTPGDLSALRSLLEATGWRVLLGVDLGHFEPARVADEAHYAQSILGASLLGIEIGNEPDEFGNKNINLRPPTYSVGEYLKEAEAYDEALRTAAPGVAIDGPATSGTRWLVEMGPAVSMFTELTQHYYATSTCPDVPSSALRAQPTAAGLLSPLVREQENETLSALAQAGAVTGRPTRIGETNSVSCRGSLSASPVFASALWSLDWVLRAASSGVTGINFHGWLGGCGAESYSPICVSGGTAEASAGDVTAQPEYYGLLAASKLEGGRFIPTHMSGPNPLPNLVTWATLTPGGAVRIAIENFDSGGLAQAVSIPVSGRIATEESLTGPSDTARSGITFGATTVTSQGRWRARTRGLSHAGGFARVAVRPASAVIVTLRPKPSRG